MLVKLDHDGICALGTQMVGLWEKDKERNPCLRGSIEGFIVTPHMRC